MRLEPYIAFRYLKSKHKNRFINLVTLFSIGGIFVGVAAIIVVISIMNGMESEIRGRILDTTAHITVFSFKPDNIGDWHELISKIEDFPNVLGASPFIQAKGAIAGPKSSDGVLIRGIDTTYEKHSSEIMDKVYWGEFKLETPDTGLPTIVLGRYLAAEINAQPNDTVSLFILRNSSSSITSHKPIVKKFVVGGIFETGMYDYDDILCYIPLSIAQKLFGMKNNITGIQVKTDDFYKARSISKKLENAIGFPYYCVSWSETNKNLFSWMTLEKWGMFLVLALIIAVAAFNIISTLMMVVMEKTVDIGILKAMGAMNSAVVKIFLIQGIIVGAIGTALGAIIGGTIVWIQQTYHIISLPPEIYSISSLPMQIRFWDIFAIISLSTVLSIISAIYPAWRAAKLKPVDAIRFG